MQNFDLKSGLKNFGSTFLWGNSVALAWTWGIGLFFSVQVAIQFGFKALIIFATIDAVGLTLFGVINGWIAKKYSNADDFETKFLDKAKHFKLGFLFYQFLAITLTLYACFKYVTLPLGILSILVAGVFFGATIFLGEEFPIRKIKYSHAVCGVLILTSLLVLINSDIFNLKSLFSAAVSTNDFGVTAQFAINKNFWSWLDPFWNFHPFYTFNSGFAELMFWVPILLGFLCGPWLDLQNWQRVIQIKKENLSPTMAYIIGGTLFWGILMADGMIAIACFEQGFDFLPELVLPLTTNIEPNDLLYSFKTVITTVLSADTRSAYLLAFYLVFIGISALTTFDSGYIAYKWYAEHLIKDSKSIVFSFIPVKFMSSPIPGFLLCITTAICTLHFTEIGKFISRFDSSLEKFFRIELEYYLAFFAAFFTIYAVVFYRNIANPAREQIFSALKLFATALCSLAAFGIGYFGENFTIMAFGSAVPFIYGWFMFAKQEIILGNPAEPINSTNVSPKLLAPNAGGTVSLDSPASTEAIRSINITELPPGAKPVSIKGCYFKDGWFVHHFIPTYQDTNSVGNIYFAMYLLWVGKTRELFFMNAMPDFDPKTSEFLILTRSIDHKFLKEIKEFDEVSIEIKISDYNRKFVTLEHRIVDLHGDIVGKGKQVLMFVNSKNYALIDLPEAVQKVYMQYVADVKDVKFQR